MTPQINSTICICGRVGCPIPFGLCHCKCGNRTPVATETHTKDHCYRGFPQRFIFGHQRRQRPELIDALPFKIEGTYCRLIPLTRGLYAIVDAADYKWLMQWKWQAKYDPSTGRYYAVRKSSGEEGTNRHVIMHRQILGLGSDDPRKGDHITIEATLDNRRKNLRPANNDESARHRHRHKNNKSGQKGVYERKGYKSPFYVEIKKNGKRQHVGVFAEFAPAQKAYRQAVREEYGEFAEEN